jgi:hypothetical protein
MRETRSSGSVEGVMSNRDPYSDLVLFAWARSQASDSGSCLAFLSGFHPQEGSIYKAKKSGKQ